jgi:transposase
LRRIEVEPNGDNTTAEELEVAMEASPTKRGYVRLATVRSLLLGVPRATVCLQFVVSDRLLRLWIHRFNEGGVDALSSKRGCGRPRKLPLERVGDLLVPVLENPSLAGQEHWTARKIHGYLRGEHGVDLSYATVVRYLREIGYTLKFPRPWATGPGKDEEAREAFKAKLSALKGDASFRLWFCDETGVEGDPRPRRRWAAKGSDPKVPYHGGHLRRSVIGAVCPEDGEFFAMQWNGCNTAVFQAFLNELAEACPERGGRRDIIVLDNASWHKSQALEWHHFEPLFLPPYSPDFNPIERLWLRMKADHFADFYTRDPQALENRVMEALLSLIADPEKVASNTAFR